MEDCGKTLRTGKRVRTGRISSQAPPVLQAADDARGAGWHIGAELLAVLVAGIGQGHVEADVAGRVLHNLLHARAARLALDLIPARQF